MRLPYVDQYRAPFVEPIGHLAMQAAYADNNLFALIAECSKADLAFTVTIDTAAHELRVWNEDAKSFASQRIALIVDPGLRNEALDALSRYGSLKTKRHRAIHDAVDVAIFGNDEVGYAPKPIQIEYRKVSKTTTESWENKITPEMIASLACEMHELQKDIDHITYVLGRVEE
ncbi:hypothetical protein [Aquamicrobium sp. LC103]|uniref:hypothetical protein n=1 Tax=Aquamicrobium sp. LC103 TaxID=1120658 RepID=UPI00063EC8D2|nr:hypothetical protein [Aquamicrobium sp. LC103]TKT78411.1 hypothetical protein XW59_012410 [Aquamicrobium sp. LC103]